MLAHASAEEIPLPMGSMRSSSQQRLDQPTDAALPARKRRSPGPLPGTGAVRPSRK
jgi:hypothetical protein